MEGILNSSKFWMILARNLLGFARKLKIKRTFTFQHNNDPKHI